MDDYSAEQHYQQQQRYQHQHQHRQYQPEQPQPQSYDPSQYQAYYASYSNHQQQRYQYYPSQAYATDSYSPQQYYSESASIHPPGVPVPSDPTHSQNHQNASYYPQLQSSLSQFPRNFDAAQTSLHSPNGQSAHRGGGRKGGRPFRGGGRGHSRGRGRGGGRYGPPHGGVSNSALSESVHGKATLTEPAQLPAAPVRPPPPRRAWCEVCRVDCNTPEILKQHENGKRHKKNLQTHAGLQNLNKVIIGQHNVQMPDSDIQTEVYKLEKVDGSREKQIAQESLPSQAPSDNDRNGTDLHKNTVDSAEEPRRKTKDQFVARGRGLKRKMRGGRGGKYIRTSEGSRRLVEPPQPKEVIPFICELCNVKCQSQVVFNSHLAGKKHLGNAKQFHGHRALNGEAGLQVLYPPNLNASSSSVTPQAQQGVSDPQVLLAQLLTYVLAQAQAPGLLAAQVPGLTAAVAPVHASSQEIQYQGSLVISEVENRNIMLEAEGQPETITTESEVLATVSIDTKGGNMSSTSEEKDASLSRDNPVIAPSEKPDDYAEQDPGSEPELDPDEPEMDPDESEVDPDEPELQNKEQDPGSEPEVDPDEPEMEPEVDPDEPELLNEEQDPGSEPEVDPDEDEECEYPQPSR